MNSQVVAAIGDNIEYYNNIFSSADNSTKFPVEEFVTVIDKIPQLNWTPFLDDDPFFESQFDSPKENYTSEDAYLNDQKLIKHLRENYDRREVVQNDEGTDILYCKTRGLVWLNT